MSLAELHGGGRPPGDIAVDDGTRTRTWAELHDRSVRVARLVRDELGVAPHEHVAYLMQNRTEIVELIVGSVIAGVWITPINWHLAEDEVAYVVEDSQTKVLFVDAHHAAQARAIADELSGVQVIEMGEAFEAALARASDELPDLDGPSGLNMIYTSGTTGRPKGVKRARPDTLREGLELLKRNGTSIGLDGGGAHLITGPMYHAAPLMFAIYDNANGAPIEIMPRWDEQAFFDTVREKRVAHTHLVPTMFVRLLKLRGDEVRAELPSLKLLLHGAAPVSVPVKTRMIEWFGPILVEYWGATEGGVNTLIGSDEWLAHPGTVGRTLPAFDVFAVNAAGERLPAGETGDLYCRHATIDRVFEYHGDPEKTANSYLEPGVFTIGDIGWVDDAGYVHLADRKSNMIISGGVNIYPVEVENCLQEHPAVADVGVFGIPDDEWGEQVKAAVELNEGFEPGAELERELIEFGREHLAHYKVPRSVDFEDELPRHPSGKLYIRRLRDRYWAGRDRSI